MDSRFDSNYFNAYGDADKPRPYSEVFMDYTIDPKVLPKVKQFKGDPWVLDLGAADGSLLREIHKVLGGSPHNYIGVEINADMCKNNVFGHIVNGNISAFLMNEMARNRTYDLIVCNAFMYMTPEEIDLCVRLIRRVLKSDGLFVSTTYSNWRFSDVRFKSETWKEVVRFSNYKDHVYQDKLKSKAVSFAAPTMWWLDTFARYTFKPIAASKQHDTFYLNTELDIGQQHYTVIPGVDSDPFFDGVCNNPMIVALTLGQDTQVLRLKQKRPRSPDNDLDGWLIADVPMRARLAPVFVKAMRSGVLGPVREFSIKLTEVPYPEFYVPGASYFPKLGLMCRDVET